MVHAEAVLARLDEAQQELGEIAALARPPVRRIAAARRAASFRSAATASMLGVLKETADAFTVQDGRG
jgi:hypothetical protein